jgi:hypothetical protein
MATRDLASNIIPDILMSEVTITTNTVTYSSSVDASDYDGGILFYTFVRNSTPPYTLAVALEESDDDAAYSTVSNDRLLAPDGAISYADSTDPDNSELKRIGAFSNKRYLRLAITSTGVTGSVNVNAYAIKLAEGKPERV